MNIDRERLAWAAGFFDGEGSFMLHTKRYARASIHQVHRAELERFVAATGVGVIRGPYREHQERQPIYVLTVGCWEEVQHLACVLWPWLSETKKQQVLSVLMSCVRTSRRLGSQCRKGHLVKGNRTKYGQCRECMRDTERARPPRMRGVV